MILGTVRGNIVSTRKCNNLVGFKLLLVEPYYGDSSEIFIAADTLGAGIDELVLVTTNSTTQFALDKSAPIDAYVVGIVDAPPQKIPKG
ncbi:MAG: EutN/CcmL family microcompartment protein [Lachnospiraceae bacterium]|nr:EutN/CcmL family microcompartment protein [Lachnospiraceae bacterium]